VELIGGNDEGGRFGTTMAAAGDLNFDGYNDVVISAPYADDQQGTVYVYHGGASGISKTWKQVIYRYLRSKMKYTFDLQSLLMDSLLKWNVVRNFIVFPF